MASSGEELKCPECIRAFDEVIYIPMELPCTHCFCKPCITRFIQTNGLCVLCHIPITKSFRELPINQGAIEYIRKRREKLKLMNEARGLINLMTNQRTSVLNVISPLTSRFMESQIYINSLHEQVQKNPPIGELKELKELIDKVINHCNYTFKLLEVFGTCWGIMGFYTHHEFFKSIYIGVQRNQTIYTFHPTNDEVKFGKVSLYQNAVLFHCIDSSRAPSVNSSFVQLEEIKKHLCLTRFVPFIIIAFRKGKTCIVFFEMFKDQRKPVNLFANLCTGEKGMSYKNFFQFRAYGDANQSSSQSGRIRLLIVENHDNHSLKLENVEDCYQGFPRDFATSFVDKCVFVEPSGNRGNFTLYSTSDPKDLPTYIGRVRFPQDLDELLNHNDVPIEHIVDCGIAVFI